MENNLAGSASIKPSSASSFRRTRLIVDRSIRIPSPFPYRPLLTGASKGGFVLKLNEKSGFVKQPQKMLSNPPEDPSLFSAPETERCRQKRPLPPEPTGL
jgi:hypothetical protein